MRAEIYAEGPVWGWGTLVVHYSGAFLGGVYGASVRHVLDGLGGGLGFTGGWLTVRAGGSGTCEKDTVSSLHACMCVCGLV